MLLAAIAGMQRHTPVAIPAPPTITAVDNGDNTVTVTAPDGVIVDNGNGTVTFTSNALTDNGDGTVTLTV